MSRPEIVMQTPAAKKLEAEVQRKLAEYSYSTADDVVMAEYVVVMLANAKTPDQITAELSELIGEDMYDPGFTTWLFEEVARQYGLPPASSTSPPSPETQEKLFQSNNPNNRSPRQDLGDKIETVNDSRDHQANNYRGLTKRSGHPVNSNRPLNPPNSNRINPGGVFSQAVTGIKRSGPNDILKDSPPHRRLRQDDYSTGPRPNDRNIRDPYWLNPMGSDRRDPVNGQRVQPNQFPFGHPMGADSAAKSILERVGVTANPSNQFRNNGFPGGYDNHGPLPFRRAKDQGLNGTSHPLAPTQQQMFYNSPSPYPLPLMHPHSFPQQHFNSHHPSNAQTPQLFLANGQPYIPPHPFPLPGSTPQSMYPYPVIQPPPGQSQRPPGSATAPPASETKSTSVSANKPDPIAQPSEPEMEPLPAVPLLREECKFNLACKNAWCTSSHCSPKGHPKTSMLLNFFPCELQLKCEDPECLKAHISPQQADPKSSIRVMQTTSKPPNSSSVDLPSSRPATMVTSINNKTIPCRFGSQCTRSDCVFSHPWIVNDRTNHLSGSITADKESNFAPSGIKNSFSTIPCKFGLQCARPDCFYQHPISRRLPSKNISKTFNNTTHFNGVTGQVDPPSSGLTVGSGALTGLNSSEKLSPSKKFSATNTTDAHENGARSTGGDEVDGKTIQSNDPHAAGNELGKSQIGQNISEGDHQPKLASNSDLTPTSNHSNNNLNSSANDNNSNKPVSTFKTSSTPIPAGV